MPIEEAKVAKADIRLLAIFQLKEPYFRNFIHYVPPKFDKPEEKFLNRYYIIGRLNEIWFYNWQTGAIYHKIHAKS